MKKVLFYATALLLAAATFVSCHKEKPTTDVTITLENSELTLGVGDEVRLNYTIAPAGTAVTLTWASDNQEVVTVTQSGIVTAVAEGTANVTASYNNASATCKITVSNEAIYDQFNLGGYGVFGKTTEETKVPGSDTVLTLSIGDVACALYNMTLLAWSDGIVFDNGFAGAGFLVEAPVSVYFILEGKYAGIYVGYGGFAVRDTVAPYYALPGKFDKQKMGDFWKGYLALGDDEEPSKELDQLYYDGLCNTVISYIDFDNQLQTRNLGYVKNAFVGENDAEEFIYYADVEFLDFTSSDRLYGFLCNLDENGKVVSLVEPYDVKTFARFATNMTSDAAPKKLMPTKSHYVAEMPVLPKKSAVLDPAKLYRK